MSAWVALCAVYMQQYSTQHRQHSYILCTENVPNINYW